ncbi:hypothetical protein HYH02_012934 [Chlamydomonas schloesseri]|uniref:Uncharacterized protein n=1 Tax=Chlamydomonas schloesseri TaxID=2026947 RepID=A0A835SV23_9CHLO|nr:hypothetical protein HYH02_012934 [Chlamydomonas schloesseri]|eukprot:KAG2432361.1 hypothetical protein HYH02_012934 [Chlamydomonas schloesseri]
MAAVHVHPLPLPLSVLACSFPHLQELSLGDAASELLLPAAEDALPATAATALARLPSLRRLRLHQLHVRSACLPGILAAFCGSSGSGSGSSSSEPRAAGGGAGCYSRLQLLEFTSPPSQQRVLGRAWCSLLRPGAERAAAATPSDGAAQAPASATSTAALATAATAAVGDARWELHWSGTLEMLAMFAQVAMPSTAAGGGGRFSGLRLRAMTVPSLVVAARPLSPAACGLVRRFLALSTHDCAGDGGCAVSGSSACGPSAVAVDTIMLCRHTRQCEQPGATAPLLAAMRQAVALLGPPRLLLLKHTSRSEAELLALVRGLAEPGDDANGRSCGSSSGNAASASAAAAGSDADATGAGAAAAAAPGAGCGGGGGDWPQELALWGEAGATPAVLATLATQLLPRLRHLSVWGGGMDGVDDGCDEVSQGAHAAAAAELAALLVAAAPMQAGCWHRAPPPAAAQAGAQPADGPCERPSCGRPGAAVLQLQLPAVSRDAPLREELNAALARANMAVQFAV